MFKLALIAICFIAMVAAQGPLPCNFGDRRCISSTQFQVCDNVAGGPTSSFNPSAQTCQTGLFCQQVGGRVDCTAAPVPCTYGDRRCISSTQFQVCDNVAGGSSATYNPSALTCQTGQKCTQSGSRVDCI